MADYASWEQIQAFREKVHGGAELLREWGSDAPAKVGQFGARLSRFIDRIESDDDFVAWMDWFDRLPAKDTKAMIKALVG